MRELLIAVMGLFRSGASFADEVKMKGKVDAGKEEMSVGRRLPRGAQFVNVR